MTDISFLAIDFETATSRRDSICEVGICVVRHGRVVKTSSWLVQPPDNRYNYWNTRIHGIRPEDTADAPFFDVVWAEIARLYLDEFDTFIAHNISFDRSCLQYAAERYSIDLPPLKWGCSYATALKVYNFSCNKLAFLCQQLGIPEGQHHRAGDDAEMCARLYLRELNDMH